MENRKLLKILKNSLPLVLIIATAVLTRILPHPPNFAPITGIALFSGSYLSGFTSFLLPLSIMLISDLFIGFHSTMIYVYGSFIVIILLGKYLRKNKSFIRLTGASFLSSVIFYLITNFGVWLNGGIYPKTLKGLEQSYVMAIPFFKNTLLGDFFYTLFIFYGFQFVSLLINKLVVGFINNN